LILAVNRAWTEFAAVNPPAAHNASVGANYFAVCDAVVGEDAAVAQRAASGIRRVIARELPEFVLEYECHSQAEQRWFMMRASHFGGEGPACAVVAHHPITERKLAEEAREASEEQFQAVVESGPVGIFIQTQGRFAYVNNFAAQLFGGAPGQLIGQEVIERMHPDWRAQVRERIHCLSELRQPIALLEEAFLHLCRRGRRRAFHLPAPGECPGVFSRYLRPQTAGA
jgi:PAS domain S-box-containing protein